MKGMQGHVCSLDHWCKKYFNPKTLCSMLSFCLNCFCRNTVYLFFYIFLVSHISILWRKNTLLWCSLKCMFSFFLSFWFLNIINDGHTAVCLFIMQYMNDSRWIRMLMCAWTTHISPTASLREKNGNGKCFSLAVSLFLVDISCVFFWFWGFFFLLLMLEYTVEPRLTELIRSRGSFVSRTFS